MINLNQNQSRQVTENIDGYMPRSVLAACFAMLFGNLLVGILVVIYFEKQEGLLANMVVIMPWITTLLMALPLILIRMGRIQLAYRFLLSQVFIEFTLLSFAVSGWGLFLGIIIFIVSSALAVSISPKKEINQNIFIGFLVGVLVFLIDFISPGLRLEIVPEVQQISLIFAVILLIIFLFLFIRQYQRLNLMTKFAIPFVLISLVAIGVLAGYNYFISQDILREITNQNIIQAAKETQDALDAYLLGLKSSLVVQANQPTWLDYLKLNAGIRNGSGEEFRAKALLRGLILSDFVISYDLLDPGGGLLLSSETSSDVLSKRQKNLGLPEQVASFIKVAVATREPQISSPLFHDQAIQPGFYVVAPIYNGEEVFGVLTAYYNFQAIQELMESYINRGGPESFPVLIDSHFMRLANGRNLEASGKFLAWPAENEIQIWQASMQMPDTDLEQITTDYPEFVAGLRNMEEQPFFRTREFGMGAEMNSAAVVQSNQAGWYVVYLQPERIFLEPLERQLRFNALIAVLVAGFTSLGAAGIARLVTQPISGLTEAAQKVAGGKLSGVHVSVSTRDEIGTLANAFNSMTTQLRQTLETLEQRVGERTNDLAQLSQQAQFRARQLETVAEITRVITSIRDIDQLLPLVVQIISERFRYYHVGIFLLDTHKEYAVLRASSSEGGKLLLLNGHRLKVGQVGIVGNVAETGQARVALDVSKDPAFIDNPNLPDTQSEACLPLKVGGDIIGVLDVQSTQPSAFSSEDVFLLSTLADQVALAIENARLFSSAIQTLAEVQSLQRSTTRQEWSSLVKKRQVLGYEYHYGKLTEVTSGEVRQELQLWEKLMQENNPIIEYSPDEPFNPSRKSDTNRRRNRTKTPSLLIPITLRGEIIGAIKLDEADRDRDWSSEELSLAKSVADQVGLALENARLLEQAQKRAEREAQMTQITGRLRTSNDPQIILQTAIRELQQALNARSARIVLPDFSNTTYPDPLNNREAERQDPGEEI